MMVRTDGRIGIRAYARKRTDDGHPITHAGVAKAIKSGRIASAVERDDKGDPWIDPARADALLAANTMPSIRGGPRRGGRPKKSIGAVAPQALEPDGKPTPSYNESRAEREAAEAKLAELKLARERGELVRADAVRVRCENVAIAVRDSLRQIPARVAGDLSAETNARRIEERLTQEIDRALEQLTELDGAG
jgi:hypothetical protein